MATVRAARRRHGEEERATPRWGRRKKLKSPPRPTSMSAESTLFLEGREPGRASMLSNPWPMGTR
jgi:hypothetical protein